MVPLCRMSGGPKAGWVVIVGAVRIAPPVLVRIPPPILMTSRDDWDSKNTLLNKIANLLVVLEPLLSSYEQV